MNFLKKLCLFILFCIVFKANSQVITVFDTIQADVGGQDAYVSSNSPANNFGNAQEFFTRKTIGSSFPFPTTFFRSYLEFDLSYIPQNAIIIEAKLRINAFNVQTGSAYDYYVERVVESWDQSTITWNNQVDSYTFDGVTVPDPDSKSVGVHEINVTNHVQNMVNYPDNNHGWRIRLNNESLFGSYGTYFRSSNYSTVSQRPRLEIKYILPIEISEYITHCTNGNSDGSINIDIEKGSTVYDEYWFFKVGASNLDTLENETSFSSSLLFENLDPGLYLFKVNDSLAITQHKFFLMGEEGDTTTVNFPYYLGEEFVEDATLVKSRSTNPAYDNFEHTNFGSSTSNPLVHQTIGSGLRLNTKAITGYNIDYSSNLTFLSAEFINNPSLEFTREINSSNERAFSVVTEEWLENVITWNICPVIDSSFSIVLPTTPVGSTWQYDTLDFLPFIEYWKSNPNYGVLMYLTDYDQADDADASYKSSGASNGVTYTLKFIVNLPISYYTTQPNLTGGYALPNDDFVYLKIKGIYNEFPMQYRLIDNTGTEVANQTDEILALEGTSDYNIKEGVKHYTLDISGLSPGYYILEITHLKGEKTYLRIKI